MILAVTIAFFMGIVLTLAVLSAFVVDIDIEKEQPDLTADILDMIRQRRENAACWCAGRQGSVK